MPPRKRFGFRCTTEQTASESDAARGKGAALGTGIRLSASGI